MHVVILARGLSVPVGGTRTYLERLIPALPNADPSIHYTVLHNSAAHQDHFPDCEQQYIPGNSAFLWEQRVFPKALGALHPDVVFCPKNLIPFGVSQKWPTVITLHDLLYYPVTQPPLREYHWYDVAYIRSFLPRSVRQAKSIVAVSEHTKRDAIKLFNINPSKIVVAHHGVEVPCETEVNSDAQHVARATFGLDKPFLFYSGSLSPRKNMARVVEAFARIAETIPHQLVVTAGKSWKDRAVFEAVKRCGLQSRFMQLGHVSPAQLNALYAAADVYLYPSLFEGFGMPVLEAMAVGCPVICSDRTSLPEVAGQAACMVNPESIDSIAQAMSKVLVDEEYRKQLIEAGLNRVKKFTWLTSAEKHVASFKRAAEPEC